MYKMRNLLIASWVIFGTWTMTAQNRNNNECTGVLKYDALSEIVEKTHYVFTGTDTTGLNVSMTKITLIDSREEWVKRKDKNCVSPKPEECVKMVLETLPPVTMNMYTLPGPDVTDQYEVRTEKVRVKTQKEGSKEIPVVCEKNRTSRLISKVQESLITLGYSIEKTGEFDKSTLTAVIDFQKSKGLAYGDLSLETLAALGVR